MRKPVVVFDTSMLGALLEVLTPVELDGVVYDKPAVELMVDRERQAGAELVLPLAAVLELGNHVMNSAGDRFPPAVRLVDLVKKAARGQDGWMVFSRPGQWTPEGIAALAETFPEQAKLGRPKRGPKGLSLADLSIVDVADYFHRAGRPVTILTTDKALKAREPAPPTPLPPRRRR